MTLGEKLKKARMDRGMSQSQVAGEFITRNMLSQLEHDQASPSLKTLEHLSSVLDVPISWLVGEEEILQERQQLKEAKRLFACGNDKACMALLQEQENLTQEEQRLLYQCALRRGESLFQSGQPEEALQAAELCLQLVSSCLYCGQCEMMLAALLRARCLMALHKAAWPVCQDFLQQYEELQLENKKHLLCAALAVDNDRLEEAERELALVSDHVETLKGESLLLKGRLLVRNGQFSQALPFLQQAEDREDFPKSFYMELYRLLEQCYKETEDYRMAYHYASLRLQNQ